MDAAGLLCRFMLAAHFVVLGALPLIALAAASSRELAAARQQGRPQTWSLLEASQCRVCAEGTRCVFHKHVRVVPCMRSKRM